MQKVSKTQDPMAEFAEGMQSFHDGSTSPFSHRQTETRMEEPERVGSDEENHVETRETNNATNNPYRTYSFAENTIDTHFSQPVLPSFCQVLLKGKRYIRTPQLHISTAKS